MLRLPAALIVAAALACAVAPASAPATTNVVMAWWQPNYQTGKGMLWESLYKPSAWDDGDGMNFSQARWTRWTRHSAQGTAHLDQYGQHQGIVTIKLSRPAYCAAIHRRAFMRMVRVLGSRTVTENNTQQCAGG